MIRETEKSQGLFSASWNHRKDGINYSESEGLRTIGTHGVLLSLSRGRKDGMNSSGNDTEIKGVMSYTFVLFRLSVIWRMLSHLGREIYLTSPGIQF